MKANKIPFNKPYMTTRLMHSASRHAWSSALMSEALLTEMEQTFRINAKIRDEKALFFTNSATQALEIMALALELEKGDEIIMPSYTYAATANAFARVGAVPVFADLDLSTMNISVDTIEPLLSSRTKAIVPIHYGGISADLTMLTDLCLQGGYTLLEDAAHGLGASYEGKPLGTIGNFGCLSFHHTKNITAAGNGGVLILDKKHPKVHVVEQIMHQGTDRVSFLRGESTEYSWQRLGGEFMMSSFNMAYLESAVKDLDVVTIKRRQLWERYQTMFTEQLETYISGGHIILPKIIEGAETNGHIYFLITKDRSQRDALKHKLNQLGIEAYSHYEPLHRSTAGARFGQTRTEMSATEKAGEGLIRLPMFYDLTFEEQDYIIEAVVQHYKSEVDL